MAITSTNTQSIRHLYNELRNPRQDITTHQISQVVARTFDSLTEPVRSPLLVGFSSTDFHFATPAVVSNELAIISAATNASILRLIFNDGTVAFQIEHSGTGPILPFTWLFSGTEVMRLTTAGHLLIGRSTDDGTGALLQVGAGGISVNGVLLTVP